MGYNGHLLVETKCIAEQLRHPQRRVVLDRKFFINERIVDKANVLEPAGVAGLEFCKAKLLQIMHQLYADGARRARAVTVKIAWLSWCWR